MQNMFRFTDSNGPFYVFFDVENGDIHNITLRDDNGEVAVLGGNIDAIKNILAKEYAATAIEMALIYKRNEVPLRC